jgi:glucosamine--fructose-6-phosphate aminotransferase (isomerizing)
MTFDPQGELPGAPDPWASSSMPAWRDAPPYAMTEMIAAEPALAERLVRRLSRDPAVASLADAVRTAAHAGEAIVLTGCGTSEHAAMIGAALLDDGLRAAGVADGRVASVQAFELLDRPQAARLLIAISHEGGTWATNQAVTEARQAGARTALVTVSGRSPGASIADLVVETVEQDQSWCHTVGYLSPMVVAATLASLVGGSPPDAVAVRALLDSADHVPAAEGMAAALRTCQRLLVVGSGVDYATARELALKIEEGAHLPATAHQLETLRHGHLAAADERTGLVLVLTDAEARGQLVVDRATAVLRSAAAIGMPAAAVLAADLGDNVASELSPAGRASVPLTNHLPRAVAAALGAAIPIQLLAERLARARGTNPDTIGREDPRQAAAADA